MLYVHLLQHQEATEKLLALLLAMKKRCDGRHLVCAQRRLALVPLLSCPCSCAGPHDKGSMHEAVLGWFHASFSMYMQVDELRCQNPVPPWCRVKGLSSAEPRQARFLRRQALMLSEALLGAMESALAKVEQDVAAGALSPSQPAAQDAAAMDADGQPAGGPSGQAQQEQHPQGESPAPAGGAAEQQSPATQAQQPALLTPGGAVAAAAPPGTTPGTDLRAVLGSPALLPSAEQEQLLERCMSLLQAVHTFQRDLSRWLQVGQPAACTVGFNNVYFGESHARLHCRCSHLLPGAQGAKLLIALSVCRWRGPLLLAAVPQLARKCGHWAALERMCCSGALTWWQSACSGPSMFACTPVCPPSLESACLLCPGECCLTLRTLIGTFSVDLRSRA